MRLSVPIIKSLGLEQLGKYTLQYYFTQKNHPEWNDLSIIGAWYVRGVCDNLFKAWKEYKSGKRGKPHFKRKSEGIGSLSYGDAAKLKIEAIGSKERNEMPRDGLINIPKLGKVKVPHLWADWGNLPIAVLRIVQRPDGWYLQLTSTKFPALSEAKRDRTNTIGLCPVGKSGVLAVDDQGREYTIALDEQRLTERREKLQQRAARQRRAVQKAQSEGQPVKGRNLANTERKIAKISRLLADRRQSQREKVASFLSRKAGAISVIKPNTGFIPHPKPEIKSGTFPAHHDPNGATAIAQANKERSTHALGEFVTLLKRKTTELDRTITDAPKVSKKDQKAKDYQALAKAIKPKL